MKIYESAVRKPISTVLIFLMVMILGIFSLSNLAIDMYPEMDMPTISVITTYEGANAADIETNVTRVLEDNLNTVDNLKDITSKSSDNFSLISLEFEWGTDLDVAANDIRDAIDRVKHVPARRSGQSYTVQVQQFHDSGHGAFGDGRQEL